MCETLFVVIPCYNEEEVLRETAVRLDEKFSTMVHQGLVSEKSKILFVDDGSNDNTWKIIHQLHAENKRFSGLSLSRNKGQQNATHAGLMTAKEYADVIITMDADLQDDIDTVEKMLDEYANGNEVVYGVRSSRKNDSFVRGVAAESFYRFMRLIGVHVIFNHSAYRLLSRRAVEALADYPEVNLFLPGIVPLLGFKNTTVSFDKKERYAGKSKYSIPKLFSLAGEAIVSLSMRPLRLIVTLGVFFLLFSVGITVYSIVKALTDTLEGWLLVLASIWAIGGTALFAIGIVGEYVGKTHLEAKRRPRYFISETLLDSKTE